MAKISPEEEARLQDILRRVRKIELTTRGLVRETVAGEYHSRFKGQGMDFDDFREYQPGDEVRAIDWNVTARMGIPYIKKFTEEREMTVFLAVDISGSAEYGSQDVSKRQIAAEVSAVFAFSAAQNQDKIGLILFSGDVEFYLPPRKGVAHVLRCIREILYWRTSHPGTRLKPPMDLLVQNVPRRSLVFIVSDFDSPDLDASLSTASVKHDVVAVHVYDPREMHLPNVGRVALIDPESGEQINVNTSRAAVREAYAHAIASRHIHLDQLLKRLAIDKVDVRTDVNYQPAIHSFFRRRSGRR